MALTGLDIFKLLPKTNCGDCGVPTCLAFGMKLAQGQAELASCPHVSDEAKAQLSEAAAPPMRKVTIGTGDLAFSVGEETVLFRHEKTLVNPPAVGVTVDASASDAEVDSAVAAANASVFERVGQTLRCGFVAVRDAGDAARFLAVVERVMGATQLPLVLVSADVAALGSTLEVAAARKPLVHAATAETLDALVELAKTHDVPLALKADGVEAVAALAERAVAAGLKDLVLDTTPSSAGRALRDLTLERRSALAKKFAPLGFPSIVFPADWAAGDEILEATYAAAAVCKYGSIIAMSTADAWAMLPLLVLRQNIFTDPQRPMQAEAKIYEFGNPGPDAPLFVTTNFSLTYFIVSSEIEGAKMPARLAIVDAEGLSVLTAWAAGKFVPERIAKFMNDSGIAETISHREVIIPGCVAQISGELAEELDGWNVVVGPYEAADIPAFMKKRAS